MIIGIAFFRAGMVALQTDNHGGFGHIAEMMSYRVLSANQPDWSRERLQLLHSWRWDGLVSLDFENGTLVEIVE